MAQYNFKRITTVPTATEFVDIVLSKTQRKNPTVVHKNYKIGRIREFYTRKIKFAQQTFHDKLNQIITDFPKLDDIHPFYADLMNVLYDKDHYKIALGEMNRAMHEIDRHAKKYVLLMKHSDTLFRCKTLKKAALGYFVTIMKKQAKGLVFLEEVRQHLARLPSIDPNTRTILLCGFPNVGKSSFINKITRADVEVQPYAFTTKSLFVGHTDFDTLRYQVIDTPGLLDRSLSERNTVEMQAITALAHLRSYIMFIVDPSENCGFTLKAQLDLFDDLKPVFANKLKMVVLNKSDVKKRSELTPEYQKMLDDLEQSGVKICEMSTMNGENVSEVKNEACKELLEQRVVAKVRSGKVDIASRIRVAEPIRRDHKERTPFIPERAIFKADAIKTGKVDAIKKMRTERDIEMEERDEYFLDLKKNYLLNNPDEKYDNIPELWEGHNIADFVDPDIEEKLRRLEDEEGLKISAGMYELPEEDDMTKNVRLTADKIREKQKVMILESNERRRVERPQVTRNTKKINVQKISEEMDIDVDDESTHFGRARSKSIANRDSRKRRREASEAKSKERGVSRNRSQTRVPPRDKSGVRDEKMATKVRKLAKIAQRSLNLGAKKGEADRRILISRPKHLFAGKRGMGKTDRR